jgi:hypothetical protein
VIKHAIPGASYVDAGPDWFVALHVGSHFETHLGRVELPPGEPWGLLFVRGSNVGGFHFAGKGHDSILTWEWRGSWQVVESVTGRGCYDQRGVYRDALPAGLQYCADDGELISRIDTYPPADGLSEWTQRGGIRIGQGHHGGGVRVFADGALRELEPGDCRFINWNRVGDAVTVSFWKEPENRAVIVQTTLSELRQLPSVGTPAPNPGPPPAPPPTPTPEPVPVPDIDYAADITEIRYGGSNPYPTPLGARHWEFLVEVAQWTETQLYRKEDSNSVLIPALGKRVSLDVIGRGSLGNRWADILQDSEGQANPVFQLADTPANGEYVDVSRVVLPGAPPPVPVPVPTPTPTPTPPPVSTLEARVEAIERWIRRAL